MDEENSIISERKAGTNDIVLGDSLDRDLGNGFSNIRKSRDKKRIVMCYPGVGTDFIKDIRSSTWIKCSYHTCRRE